jgi:elongation factor P hydroxylase
MESNLEAAARKKLEKFGYKFERNGAHSARTMMFDELKILFSSLPIKTTKAEYVEAIIEGNLLNKPSKKSRQLTG